MPYLVAGMNALADKQARWQRQEQRPEPCLAGVIEDDPAEILRDRPDYRSEPRR